MSPGGDGRDGGGGRSGATEGGVSFEFGTRIIWVVGGAAMRGASRRTVIQYNVIYIY